MTATFMLVIRKGDGSLWDRITGAEADLRDQGVGFTTGRGQTTWTCALWCNGAIVAMCKRGVWTEAKS